MTPRPPSQTTDDRGTALGDALLETCRPLPALSPAAHARVKRRLARSLARRTSRRVRWLKPVVVTAVLLLCGAAFGVALDRLVLTRPSSATGDTITAADPVGRRSRAHKAPWHRATPAAQPPPVTNSPDVAVGSPAPPHVRPLPTAAEGKPTAPPGRAPSGRLAGPSPDSSAERARSKLATHQASPEVSAHQASPFPAPESLLASSPALPPQSVAPSGLAPPPALAPAPALASPPPPSAPPRPSPPPGPSEERLLAAAVRALRTQNDAGSALGALDEYEARYPHGRLSLEASALRASALIALDRRDEALRVLDGLDLAHVPGGFERQLQRGELRALAGRQREAVADFDAVLERIHHGDLAERALWGRAQSRLGIGDRAGARKDAALYLQRHPSGQFAGPAARLTGAAP